MIWHHRSATITTTCSSDDHLKNVLERPHSCGCTASECDGFTCVTIASTTVQEHSADDHYIVEKSLLDPVDVIVQEVIETLNILVNDGSSVGACTLDLVAPPRLASKMIQFPTLEPKWFLRDLRSGKVK